MNMPTSILVLLVSSFGFSTSTCNCDCHFKYFEIIEPVELPGEGRYNLNDMKEIIVTDSYLELDQTDRACQNKESLHSCTTRLYSAAFIAQCGCVPFNITPTETPLCSGAQLSCVQNTPVDTSSCLPPCSGLFVTGFSKSEQGEDSFQMDRATLKAYRDYTKWTAFPSELKGNFNGVQWSIHVNVLSFVYMYFKSIFSLS